MTNKDKILKNYISQNKKTSRRKLQKVFPWLEHYLRNNFQDSIDNWYKHHNLIPPRKNPNKTKGRVGERSLKIIQFVIEQGICITQQIMTLVGEISSRTTYDYLLILEKFGYLKGTTEHHRFKLWYATKLGKDVLLKHTESDLEKRHLSSLSTDHIPTHYIDHDLLVNDLRLVFSHYWGKQLVRWYSERMLSNFDLIVDDRAMSGYRQHLENKSGRSGFNRPDAIVEYIDDYGTTRHVWIELERTRKTIPRYTKLFEQNLAQFKTLKEPFEDGVHFDDIDYFFYIAGPHSSSVPWMLNARRKLAHELLLGKDLLLERDFVDFRENEELFSILQDYYEVSFPRFGLPDELISLEECMFTFSRLPHLAVRDDLDMRKIVLFTWDRVRRPNPESKLYRENEIYREIVKKYDGVNSFLGRFETDVAGHKIDLQWVNNYVKPVKVS